jgi:hypothetical protein
MKRKVIFAVILLVILGAALWLRKQILIDRCLDSGGRWSETLDACEH